MCCCLSVPQSPYLQNGHNSLAGKARRAGVSKKLPSLFSPGLVLSGWLANRMPWIQAQARLPRLLSSCAGQADWVGISPTLPNTLPLSLPSQWLTQLTQEKYVSLPLSSALHFFVTFLDQKRRKEKRKKINMRGTPTSGEKRTVHFSKPETR